jgi:hypothetical protein
MREVKIQTNIFEWESNPTTQEDNHFGIADRYTLYQAGVEVGKLVKYINRDFAMFINRVRIDLPCTEIGFI